MRKQKVWFSMCFISFISCIILLILVGWNIPYASAQYYSQDSDLTCQVTPSQLNPDPATQTVTLYYEIKNAVFDGEWWAQVNYVPEWGSLYHNDNDDYIPPISASLKKSLTSEKKNGKISGSWTIQLWNIAGANKPVQLGTYCFRVYGPKNEPGYYMYTSDLKQGKQYYSPDSYFKVVNVTDVILSCPPMASPGDKIDINWQKASQNIGAWIGIYKKDDPDTAPISKIAINQNSIGAEGTGKWTMSTWLWPGQYEFRIFQDNGYILNGKAPLTVLYKTPNLTAKPQQGKTGDTLVISWTDGPNYISYGDSVRIDLYQNDKFYTNLQTGIWPEGTINFKIRQNMPSGTYQVRMINGHDESLMASFNIGVEATQASTSGTGTTTTPSTGSTGTPATTQSPTTGSTTTTSTGTTSSAKNIIITVGQPVMTINGASREYGQDAEPMMINGKLYAPVQPVAEAMGATVDWNTRDKKMTITTTACSQESQQSQTSNNTLRSTPSSSDQSSIIGLWKVFEGTSSNQYMYLYQEGGKIAGLWNDRSIITGSMNGNVFKGEYHGTVNPNGSALTMTLTDNGASFEGTYVHGGKNYPIRGIKNTDGTTKIKASPTSGASDADFGGTWSTTAGNILITQEGTKIKGTWEDKTVTGKVEGNVLNGRYYSTRYPEMIWDFNMTMKPDGKTCVLFHTKQGGVLINTWRK
jgi:hypothetical protein